MHAQFDSLFFSKVENSVLKHKLIKLQHNHRCFDFHAACVSKHYFLLYIIWSAPHYLIGFNFQQIENSVLKHKLLEGHTDECAEVLI